MIRKDDSTGIFLDCETSGRYLQIVGGLAWPFGERPGYLIVVAEDFWEDRTLGARPLNIIAERESPDMDDIVRHYRELSGLLSVGPWVSDPENRGMLRYCQQKNPQFSLYPAPYFDDPRNLEYYFQLFRTLTKEERKVLHFNNHEMIRGYLNGLPPEEFSKPAKEHPPAAALGYAITYLDQNKPVKQRKSHRRRDGMVC
jgi:hypothetical protein